MRAPEYHLDTAFPYLPPFFPYLYPFPHLLWYNFQGIKRAISAQQAFLVCCSFSPETLSYFVAGLLDGTEVPLYQTGPLRPQL